MNSSAASSFRLKNLSTIGASRTRWAAWALAFGVLAIGCKSKEGAEPGQPGAAKTYDKGPHGGRLLSDGAFAAEVTIYERGVPPQFRVYFYDGGKPVAPSKVKLEIVLTRLGGRVDRFPFKPEQDYLVSDKVVEEPHSFDVSVVAESGGQHSWKFSQREGRVEMSDETVKSSAIEVSVAGPLVMRSELNLPGEIQFNADRLAHVVPRMTGVMREVRKNLGDEVKKGEVIAVLESRELAETKRAFVEATHELAFAKRAYEREEGLWKKNISSESSYLTQERLYHEALYKLQSAEQQLEALGIGKVGRDALLQPGSTLTRYELRAPFDGVITEKNVALGQAVKEFDDLFMVADLSTVWVEIAVYAKDLNDIKVGQDVTVRSEAPAMSATGKIAFVGALVAADTRAAKARVILPNAEHQWRAGLFVNVAVVQNEVPVAVAVKREGLQKFRDWDVVFIRSGNEFEARPLQLGREDGEWVEVLSGLSAGEQYASSNSFILKADVGKAGAGHDH